jgi:hypothetical protein
MYGGLQDGGVKVTLRNREDFINFYTQLADAVRHDEPTHYPCVIVQWDGEDSGYWEEYEFVYLEDFN